MEHELRRICELQESYSSENTPAMRERGALIRTQLPGRLRELVPSLADVAAEFANVIAVEGSDGIGRKTEAPWVRLFAPSMSPNPRTGYYAVIHFAADGSAVFVTVGCGSTVWKEGDLKSVSDEELLDRTDWARRAIQEQFGSLAPFTDQIALGAKASLPRTFEKATVEAKRIERPDLRDESVYALIREATAHLIHIYRCQAIGRDVQPALAAEAEVEAISRPRNRRPGQGFSLSAAERKAVELRAMSVAAEWLQSNRYTIEDTSATRAYDFLATSPESTLKVEVKGTTSDACDSIMMTRNELLLHRSEKGKTALIIVSAVRLDRSVSPPIATGGSPEVFLAWDVDLWTHEAIAYQINRRAF